MEISLNEQKLSHFYFPLVSLSVTQRVEQKKSVLYSPSNHIPGTSASANSVQFCPPLFHQRGSNKMGVRGCGKSARLNLHRMPLHEASRGERKKYIYFIFAANYVNVFVPSPPPAPPTNPPILLTSEMGETGKVDIR